MRGPIYVSSPIINIYNNLLEIHWWTQYSKLLLLLRHSCHMLSLWICMTAGTRVSTVKGLLELLWPLYSCSTSSVPYLTNIYIVTVANRSLITSSAAMALLHNSSSTGRHLSININLMMYQYTLMACSSVLL